MPSIALDTRDGECVRFEADSADTLLDAAAKARLFLPALCRKGRCGACRVKAESGEVRLDDCSLEALSEADRAAGGILLCRAHAAGDLNLRAPFDHAAIAFGKIPDRAAVVRKVRQLGPHSAYLRLALEEHPDFGSAADFLPGQFFEVTVPGTEERRAYTPANVSNFDGILEFLADLQPGGVFSEYLSGHARSGDRLLLTGPQGGFSPDDASPAPRWLVADGSGLAPVLSLLTHMMKTKDGKPCRVVCHMDDEAEGLIRERITALRVALPQLTVTTCAGGSAPETPDRDGALALALKSALEANFGAAPDLYLCGSPSLVAELKSVAARNGISPDRIFTTSFAPAV